VYLLLKNDLLTDIVFKEISNGLKSDQLIRKQKANSKQKTANRANLAEADWNVYFSVFPLLFSLQTVGRFCIRW
jgi:hypothetical protein